MYLYIDPSVSDHIHIVLYCLAEVKEYTIEGRNRELLNIIVSIFTKENISITGLKGIVLLVGEGGFSSTRIAAVVGNTLSFALSIPIVGVIRENIVNQDSIPELLSHASPGVYISPAYSGEPNIGTPHS